MNLPWLLIVALALWAIWQTMQTQALSRRLGDAERMILDLADMIERRPAAPVPQTELLLDKPLAAPARAPAPAVMGRLRQTLAHADFGMNLAWASVFGTLIVFAYALHPAWGAIEFDAPASVVTATLLTAFAVCIVVCVYASEVGHAHDDPALRGAALAAAATHMLAASSLFALFMMRGAEMNGPFPPTNAHGHALTVLWLIGGLLIFLLGGLAERPSLRRFGAIVFAATFVKIVLFDMQDGDAGQRAFLFIGALMLTGAWFLRRPPAPSRLVTARP